MPLYPASNLIYFNVKNYGALGNGSTDDTAAITAAISAATTNGGTVFFPSGTYISTTQTLVANVHIRGAGIEATIIKLKNSANADLFSAQTSSINLSASSGAGSAGSLYNFGFYDLTLDGNKSNQSSGTSYLLRFYGYGYIIQNVRMRNGYTGGVLSDWNGGAASPGQDAMESQWTNVKIHDCNGICLQLGGPHDSQFVNMEVYNAGTHCIHIAPNATAIQATNVHAWGIGTGSVGFLVEASYCLFYNCEAEFTTGMAAAILGPECSWDGHIFGTSSNTSNGLQIGQTSGNAPYTGQILQSAGVTTTSVVGNCHIRGNFDYCAQSHGALWFANSGGGNMIITTIYQTTGSAVTGTPHSQDSFWIYIKGLTPDGSLGKSGGFQMASSSYNAWMLNDQLGQQVVLANPASGKFLVGNGAATGGYIGGFSDTSFSTQQWSISNANGDIATNGNISTGQSATAAAVATSGTITTADIGEARVSPTGAVTGVILQAGTVAGQEVWVVNQAVAANSVTFAASGTSHVADGVSSVIVGLRGAKFKWDSGTSLWYRG